MATIVDKETDARFWAQTNYKPGQKLDPKNPTDATLIPIWRDIFKKVQAEDTAGKLVLTYNHPVVAQHQADAAVADQATSMHLDAAAKEPDPAVRQQHVVAAATAAQVSAQKSHAASKLQPPSISPQRAQAVAQVVKHSPPPPPSAPAPAHVAHQQAQAIGHHAAASHEHHRRYRRPVKSAVSPGTLKAFRDHAIAAAHASSTPYVLMFTHPDGTPEQHSFNSRAELDDAYAQLADRHDQYTYAAAIDFTANASAPVHDSVGVHAAEHADIPPEARADVAPTQVDAVSQADAPASPDTTAIAPVEEKPGMSTGKIVAIGVGIAAAGGLLYALTHKNVTVTRRSVRA